MTIWTKQAWTELNRRAPLLILMALALLIGWLMIEEPRPQRERHPASSSIPVADEIRSFYEDHGGAAILGQPLSGAYVTVKDNRLVQSFQRVRLEFDPESGQVTPARLGRWILERAGVALEASGNTIVTSGAFLEFYQENSGERLLGKPLTGELDEGGRLVQYFEYGRLDWHPELPFGYRVQLGPLGVEHYRQIGALEDPGHGRARPVETVGEVEVGASFQSPILFSGDHQVIFVNVAAPGEAQEPVQNVKINLTVSYEEGSHKLQMGSTNEHGSASSRLDLPGVSPGQRVRVEVTALDSGGKIIGGSSASFRAWW